MNSELQQSIDCWPQWITQYQFDPIFGYLIDPDYVPVSFDYQTLHKILSNLHIYNKNQQIVQIVKNMPQISLKPQLYNHKQMAILHDLSSYLIHSFIKISRDLDIHQDKIVCPKNLATLLVQSASYLRIKTGMATGIGYNWYFKNNKKPQQLDQMTIQDIQIKYYYSIQHQYQGLFFKVSVVTSYLLGRIIKNCYQINCIVTQQPNLTALVLDRMKKIKYYLKRIYDVNMEIHRKMSKQFFFYTLRIFVSGYQYIMFQGINQRVSSSGGAGGYDPSFQAFQRAFTVFFQDQIGHVQQKLRHGMSKQNLALIDFFAQNSIIRDYCQCTTQLQNSYNQVLQGYARYLELHGTFIRNYILNMLPSYGPKKAYGAAGQGIQRIMDKFKFVRQHQLHQQNIIQALQSQKQSQKQAVKVQKQNDQIQFA